MNCVRAFWLLQKLPWSPTTRDAIRGCELMRSFGEVGFHLNRCSAIDGQRLELGGSERSVDRVFCPCDGGVGHHYREVILCSVYFLAVGSFADHPSNSHRLAAADLQDFSGDPRSLIRRKEQRRVGNIVHITDVS